MNTIFFIGAGGSVPFGIPTMTEMVQGFEEWMKKSNSGLDYVEHEIKNKLSEYKQYDIEALITVLQDIIDFDQTATSLYSHPSLHFFSPIDTRTFKNTINTLGSQYHNEAIQLLNGLKSFIISACDIKKQPFELYMKLFRYCIRRYDASYETKLLKKELKITNEIFTTNYDMVLEAYCSHYELAWESGEKQGKLDISESNENLFNSNVHSIYKLHGSINWYFDGKGNMRVSSEPVKIGTKTSLGYDVGRELLVYPAFSKYTFREPFYTMFHHLKECLSHCIECYIVGYSFRDEDILGLFHDALMVNKSLKLILIDPNADNIKNQVFHEYLDRVHSIPHAFDEEAINSIDAIKLY